MTLMAACLGVVVRREMSLNRRLYAWILGSTAENSTSQYFEENTKEVVIQAVKKTFTEEPHDVASATRPYKVLMALLDKEEIGSAIIEELLVDVLRPVLKYKDGHAFFREISNWVTQVIDALQPRLLWESIGGLLVSQLSRLPQQHEQIEALSLIDCLLDNLSLTDAKTQTIFLPSMLERSISGLSTITKAIGASTNRLEKQVIAGHLYTALQLALKVIGKIYPPETADQLQHSSSSISVESDPASLQIAKIVGCTSLYEDYFSLLVEQILPICGGVQNEETSWDTSAPAVYLSIFDISCQLLVTVHTYFHKSDSRTNTPSTQRKDAKPLKGSAVILGDVTQEELPRWFDDVHSKCSMAANPQIACFGIQTFISFVSVGNTSIPEPLQKRIVCSKPYTIPICRKLWNMSRYSYALSAVHYKVASLFLNLRGFCEDVICTVIAEDLLQQDVEKRVDGYQRFALIWRLTGEISSSDRAFTKRYDSPFSFFSSPLLFSPAPYSNMTCPLASF
jgi:hypothetical protein